MSPDRICSILAQTPMALLVIKEQVGSPQAIHLHMLQLPKDQVTLQYVHYHSRIPGEHGRMGLTRVVSHRHLQHHGVFLCWGLVDPFPQHLPVHWTAPAWKIAGHHPAACIPLVHLGNTSLQSPHACQSPSQVHNSYN